MIHNNDYAASMYELQAEIDALKAQNKISLDLHREGLEPFDMDKSCDYNDRVTAVIAKTPAQCLASVESKAIVKAVFSCGVSSFKDAGEAVLTSKSLTDYAAGLLAQEQDT